MNLKIERKNLWNAVRRRDASTVELIYKKVDEEYFKRLRRIEESGYEPMGWESFQEFWGTVCSAVIDSRRGFNYKN